MKYLLDTDAVIDHLRGKKKINDKIISEGASISIISYGELLYGAYKSQDKEKSTSMIKLFISDLSIKITNLSEEIMREYAEIKAKLELAGKKLDEFDLLNGATAKIHSFTLITRNIKHFKRINGLKLVNI